MKTKTLKKSLVLCAVTSAMFLMGCELIVDFDRTRIPADTTEASVPDATTVADATVDAPTTDASDAGDASADAPSDAGLDADAAD